MLKYCPSEQQEIALLIEKAAMICHLKIFQEAGIHCTGYLWRTFL
jgi:hypothetical protein